MQRFKRLLHYVWPHMRRYPKSFYLTFIGYGTGWILATLVSPLISREIIDVLSTASIRADVADDLMKLVLFLLVNIVVANIFFRISDYSIVYFSKNVDRDILSYLFNKLEKHSYSFFVNRFAGSIVTATKRFVRAVNVMHDKVVYNFWGSFIQIVGMMTILFFINTYVALIFTTWVVIFMIITSALVKKRIKLDLAAAKEDSRITGLLADAITNILNIKMFARAKIEHERFSGAAQTWYKTRYRSSLFSMNINTFQAFMIGALEIVGMFAAIKLWVNGTISTGTVVLVQAYFAGIFMAVWNLGRALSDFSKSLSDASEMVEILDMPLGIKEPADPEKVRIKDGHIEIKDMSFNYLEGQDAVFKNFNLDVPSGQKVGLVGHSGTGKTTITKLILRFADVTAGSIKIDGQDIRNIAQDGLRGKIAYVPQEPMLFHRSISENIGYGNPKASQEEIVEAAKKAHAHEFIETLPYGYDTLVGERGIKLSGGERQRVAIARAMLKNAPVLVLDEATSSLDVISEEHIQEAFIELMKNRTTLVVAHRLSTIQKMDRIIVFENGKIAEDGTHEELLEKKGIYHNFWTHQAGGFIE